VKRRRVGENSNVGRNIIFHFSILIRKKKYVSRLHPLEKGDPASGGRKGNDCKS
jgi:hypothetical protein